MNGFDLSTISSVYVGSTLYSLIYMGSNKLWPAQTTLPYDAEIEYLDGNGSLYIDLNIIPDENTGIYIKTIDNILSGSFDCYVAGLRDNPGNTRWAIGHDSVEWYYGYGQFGQIVSTPYNGCVIEATLNYLNSKTATCTANGTTSTKNLPSLSFTPSSNIRIFGSSGISTNYSTYNGKIYSFKVSLGNTCIMDLIPVRVGQVGYMYDKIEGLLYGNDGTGSFTLGPDKPLPPGYTELEYISSSSGGNQYIDLGIKLYETLNTNYDIAMKFNIASGNANQAAIFACQDSDNDPWPGTFVRVNSSSGKAIGRYIGGTAKDNTIGNIGADIELPVQTSPNKNVTSLNNNNTTHQYGTSLFCAFVGGTNTPARYCNAKLYYFKLFVGGTLVRDLIPCKNSNNVVGMYDVVNNVFYTSPNGNAFVAGPDKHSANFLDILYADSNGNLSIDSLILPSSEGKTPIGLCISPTGFFGINEPARWMSLKYMNCTTPDSGSLNGSVIYYGNYQNDITSITNIQKSYVSGSDSGYLSDISADTPQIPSLFDTNNNWNLSELGTVNNYAVTDIDGKVKTNKMLETATAQVNWRTDSTITLDYRSNYAPSACCCWRYHPLGTQQGDWYLGSCGEMSMMIAKKTNINTKLAAINAIYPNDCISSLAVQWYSTSTKYSTACPWMLSSYNGRVKKNEDESYYILALLQY